MNTLLIKLAMVYNFGNLFVLERTLLIRMPIMIEVIRLIPKSAYHFLIFILPFFLMSCVTTPSHDVYSLNKKTDRFQMMVVYIKKTIADNPKYQTVEGKKNARSLNKFIGLLQNQVKDKTISNHQASDILSEVFNQFENDKYSYKSAKALFYEHKNSYHRMNYSPPDTDTPWPPEEEPLN